MKKTLLNFLTLFFFAIATTFAQNLVVNGGFEDGVIAPFTSFDGISLTDGFDLTNVSSGSYALEITNTKQAFFGQAMPQNGGGDPSVDFLPDFTYLVSVSVKSDGGIGGIPGDAYMSIQYKDNGGPFEYLNYVNIKDASTTGFGTYSFKVNASAAQLESLRVAFFMPNGGGLYWLDDITVAPDGGGSSANDITATSNGTLDAVNNKITIDVTSAVTAETFLAGLTVSVNATAQLFNSVNKFVGANDNVASDQTIKVFAEDGTFKEYTIEAINDAVILSVGGGLTLNNTEVSNIIDGTTADDLLSVLELYPNATAEVLDGGSPVIGTDAITESMIVRVTGSDGSSTQDYTLKLSPLTNVVAGNTNITLTMDDPSSAADASYVAHTGTSLDGITDGIVAKSSNRWLFEQGSGDRGGILPVNFEIDLGGSFYISAFTITQVKSKNAFTFETWNGSSWDVQHTQALVDDVDQVTINDVTNALPITVSFPEVNTSKIRVYFTENGDSSTRKYVRVHELVVLGSSMPLSVNDAKVSQFKIYPNPVEGSALHLKSNSKIESVEVYNIVGKKINVSFNSNTVDVSKLSSGMYLIRINNSETLKFIKK